MELHMMVFDLSQLHVVNYSSLSHQY